jgi:hypothetical protein
MRLKDAKTYVKPPDNVDDVRTTRGNTSDIIDTIMFADRFEAQRNLTKDEAGYERVKSSNKTIFDGFGDCKSFTILEISLLRELGITCKYKFVSWQAGQPVTHVYAVAIVDNQEILLDAVHTKFNDEVAYVSKIERQMTKIAHVHGISKIGNIDVPKPVYLNYHTMTDGELSLQIMREKLVLFKSVHPESKLTREWQAGIELIDNAIYKGVHGLKGATWTPSYGVDLNKVKYAIQEAAKRFAPAGNNRIELVDRKHVGVGSDPLIQVEDPHEACKFHLSNYFNTSTYQYTTLPASVMQNNYEQCRKDIEATIKDKNLLNKYLESSAHHVLYEFEKSADFYKQDKNVKLETLNKILEHKRMIPYLVQSTSLSYQNIREWADLGIRRRSSTKDLGAMSGIASTELLRQFPNLGCYDKYGNAIDCNDFNPDDHVGDFGLSAAIGLAILIFTSATAIAGLIQVFQGKEPTAFGYGLRLLQGSVKALGKDWAGADLDIDIPDIPTGGSGNGNTTTPTPCGEGMTRNATTGVCEAEKKEGISTNLLIGGGLLLGGALLLSGNSK